jgi:hypothetical protein
MKLKKELGQRSINKTMAAKKADQGGEPEKTLPLPPKADKKEAHTKAYLEAAYLEAKGPLSGTAALWLFVCLNDSDIIFI